MPAISKSNNRILPANARAADVAERAIQEIIPVQQRRYYDAFRPQGIKAIAYNRLQQGRPCSCQAQRKTVNGLLNEEGKASPGLINQMLTGNMSFNVTPYGHDQGRAYPDAAGADGQTSPLATVNKNQGVFDIVTAGGEEFPFAHSVPDEEAFGDNGPSNPVDIDSLVADFDVSALGYSDVACPICFGNGFIGGYAPFNSNRIVLTVTDLALINGTIDTTEKPLVARDVQGFNQKVVLPRGALAVESFTVWNGLRPVPATFLIDGSAVTGDASVLARCDGKPHLLTAQFTGDFTHLELQFTMSDQSLYFELPRRPSTSDTSLLEQMEPFQIILSPNIPQVDSMDVLVEAQYGKTLVVQNVHPWNSRQRNILGWECQVRVIQPQEIFRILPQMPRTLNKTASTMMARDNRTGVYRT